MTPMGLVQSGNTPNQTKSKKSKSNKSEALNDNNGDVFPGLKEKLSAPSDSKTKIVDNCMYLYYCP